MITVSVNKKVTEIEEGTTVTKLLTDRGNPKSSVWINGKQLLRADYDSITVKQGDDVRVLRIVAGG